jgi:hypothetical protein
VLEPILVGLRVAGSFVGELHRHHGEPQGHKFSIGASDGGRLCGVVIVGRPVSRNLDNGFTAEVTRLCTDGTRNACSFLYGAAARAAKEQGYRKIITYVLESESGDSLRAAGWVCDGPAGGGSWSSAGRKRIDKHPTGRKVRWSRHLRGPQFTPTFEMNDNLRNLLLWVAIAV